MEPHQSAYYSEYLELDKILNAQNPLSKKEGRESHDETLFIIVHQAYEIWFKQILHELKSIQALFANSTVKDSELSRAVAQLERIKKIQKVLLEQINIVETLTPMDFLEFRDLLIPASGFQSRQYREIEIRFGLFSNPHRKMRNQYFLERLSSQDRNFLLKVEKAPSLLVQIQNWLERMPYSQQKNFNFWKEYESAVKRVLDQDQKTLKANLAKLNAQAQQEQMNNLKTVRQTFASLFDSREHEKLVEQNKRTLSQKAILNALFIFLYRDHQYLHLPYLFLNALIDIDENMTAWRYRHALMAQRILGMKMGTGGTSGQEYLKKAAENNRFYPDLVNLPSFMISRSHLPQLPLSEISQE